jgi:hypothetical protein
LRRAIDERLSPKSLQTGIAVLEHRSIDMSKPFTLSVQQVECIAEQYTEPGKDELFLLGFGITKNGQRFTIRPRKLGNFSSGDVSGTGYPKTLVDIQVPDNEDLVYTCIWLFEQDWGDLADADLEAEFNRYMDLNLPSNDTLYDAFIRAMIDIRHDIKSAAKDFLNSDDLLDRVFHDHAPTGLPPFNSNTYLWISTSPGTAGAVYQIHFRYRLDPVEPVVVAQ